MLNIENVKGRLRGVFSEEQATVLAEKKNWLRHRRGLRRR